MAAITKTRVWIYRRHNLGVASPLEDKNLARYDIGWRLALKVLSDKVRDCGSIHPSLIRSIGMRGSACDLPESGRPKWKLLASLRHDRFGRRLQVAAERSRSFHHASIICVTTLKEISLPTL